MGSKPWILALWCWFSWPGQSAAESRLITVGTGSEPTNVSVELVRNRWFWSGSTDVHGGMELGIGRCFGSKYPPFNFVGSHRSMAGNWYGLIPMILVKLPTVYERPL